MGFSVCERVFDECYDDLHGLFKKKNKVNKKFILVKKAYSLVDI